MRVVTMCVALVGAASARGALAQVVPPNADRLLTTAEVERAAGVKGLSQHAKKDPMDSDVNFVEASGNPVLALTFHPVAAWDIQKKAMAKDLGPLVKPIAGLGEDAYDLGETSLLFRKGRYAVQLVVGVHVSGDKVKTFLTHQQVVELAKLIASRL